jgi:hypothetical protein
MTRTTDPMTLLADQVGALAEDGYRRRRATDLTRITATAREPVRTVRRVPRRLFVLAGTAGAAAVVAALVAVPSGSPRHGTAPIRTAPPLDARSFLLASADISEKTPVTGHGGYWYSQIRSVERARRPAKGIRRGSSANGAPRSGPFFPFRAYVSITWENWDPYQQGRPSRMVDRDISTGFATPADKAAWQRAGSPSLTDMKPFSADSRYNEPYLELGPKGTKMADLPKLPHTAAGLERLIRADRERRQGQLRRLHAGPQEPPYLQDVYDAGIGIITSPTTPKVRAAAYRMLAAQHGIRSLGNVRDALGRPGVALAVPFQRARLMTLRKGEEHLIIDPATAKVLAREFYPYDKSGKPASEPAESTLMISDGWTGRIGVPARG